MPQASFKRDPRYLWFWKALAPPVALFMFLDAKLTLWTSRISVAGPGANHPGPAIYVNWHRYVSFLCIHHGRYHRCLLMSSSPYLEPVAMWCRWMGLTVIRGSPGERSGESLGRLAQALRSGESVVLAADGPAGPGFQVKRGCIDLARATGAPIIPVACHSRKGKSNEKRWDRFYNVRSFDEITVSYGEPIVLNRSELDEAALMRVKSGLDRLEAAIKASSA